MLEPGSKTLYHILRTAHLPRHISFGTSKNIIKYGFSVLREIAKLNILRKDAVNEGFTLPDWIPVRHQKLPAEAGIHELLLFLP